MICEDDNEYYDVGADGETVGSMIGARPSQRVNKQSKLNTVSSLSSLGADHRAVRRTWDAAHAQHGGITDGLVCSKFANSRKLPLRRL